MTPEQIEAQRPAFEAWAMANLPGYTLVREWRGGKGRYYDRLAEWAFQGWLAAKADQIEVTEERNRIADALDHEASVCPCAEDAVVIRDCAKLVRADFSYEQAEANEAAALNSPSPQGTEAGK